MSVSELVVNWHITEACNFKCKYCFSHWEKDCKKELLHSRQSTFLLLREIAKLPALIFAQNGYSFDQIRLNLVGGETFLYKESIKAIMQLAKAFGFRLSAITNGSTLDDELIHIISQHFDMIGFSVDSVTDETNVLIGREIQGKAMQAVKIQQHIAKLRKLNPNIKIKINTVVNRLNWKEDLNGFIFRVMPDKWKIFKMLPITTQKLSIEDFQFQYFLDMHLVFKHIISSENNDEMTASYLMIDPLGRFFSNAKGIAAGYDYSEPILQVGIEKALSQVDFDLAKFIHRY